MTAWSLWMLAKRWQRLLRCDAPAPCRNHPEGSGIVYCLSRDNTETVAATVGLVGFVDVSAVWGRCSACRCCHQHFNQHCCRIPSCHAHLLLSQRNRLVLTWLPLCADLATIADPAIYRHQRGALPRRHDAQAAHAGERRDWGVGLCRQLRLLPTSADMLGTGAPLAYVTPPATGLPFLQVQNDWRTGAVKVRPNTSACFVPQLHASMHSGQLGGPTCRTRELQAVGAEPPL